MLKKREESRSYMNKRHLKERTGRHISYRSAKNELYHQEDLFEQLLDPPEHRNKDTTDGLEDVLGPIKDRVDFFAVQNGAMVPALKEPSDPIPKNIREIMQEGFQILMTSQFDSAGLNLNWRNIPIPIRSQLCKFVRQSNP